MDPSASGTDADVDLGIIVEFPWSTSPEPVPAFIERRISSWTQATVANQNEESLPALQIVCVEVC
jgi:hypothetical protein